MMHLSTSAEGQQNFKNKKAATILFATALLSGPTWT
jgi:hypothetical protein